MARGDETIRLVRVFVSSPGDCTHERQVLDEVVERINKSESDRTGLRLRTFKWEDDVVPRIGPPPQTLVDEQTPLCDIYLGIMSSDSTDARVRAARLQQDRSLLDSVTDRVKQLQPRLGSTDNRKVNDYLASLRDVERRIQKAEEQSSKEVPDVERPAGVPDGFEPHVRLLYDLQLLTLLGNLGVPTEKLGDSTGQFKELFGLSSTSASLL
jgi:hypothetical protein